MRSINRSKVLYLYTADSCVTLSRAWSKRSLTLKFIRGARKVTIPSKLEQPGYIRVFSKVKLIESTKQQNKEN